MGAPSRRSLALSRALPLEPQEGESLDAICGGRVQLLQHRAGYRFNLDPILLAHFAAGAPGGPRGPALDLGAGCGVIALILARKFGLRELTALEIQPALHALTQRNVRRNRAAGRVTPVLGDLRRAAGQLPAGAFAQVICNPPYRAQEAGRLNPRQEKAIARHELLCTLEDVAAAAAHALRDRGVLSVVYPAARLCELTEALRRRRLEPKRLRLVHPCADRPAKLLLLQAVKGGRAQLEVLPPCVLHAGPGAGYTAEVRAMIEEGLPGAPAEPASPHAASG